MIADELFSVAGQTIVVTGGLGQLGRAFVAALLARQARVALLDARGVSPRELEELFAPHGSAERLRAYEVSVTDRAALEGAHADVHRRWGAPHGLLNNAALDSPPGAPAQENGPFETYPEASFDAVMEVNVKGVVLASQVFGGAMAEAGRGSIVNISSIYGLVSPDQRIYDYRRRGGEPFYKPVAYSVSKSALLNLTRYLATYWAPRGVRVNTLTFGGVFNRQEEEFLRGYTAHVPLGRMANPEDYTAAVVFLMSRGSAYMTGANLVVDGGWTAW